MKKFVSLTLAAIFAFGAQGFAVNATKANTALASDKKVTLTMFEVSRAGYEEASMIEEEINKRSGYNIEYIKVPEPNLSEQLGLLLASQKLPDLVNIFSKVDIANWVSQGALVPIEDLLEEHGKDIIANWIEEDYVQATNAADGRIYTVPSYTDVKGAFSVQIRKDWLDKLELDIPETLDEWRTVLEAFRDSDLAGEGKSVIPYAGRLRAFDNAFDIRTGDWAIQDGKYVARYEREHYIEYLEYMRGLYEDKLIDPEYVARNKVQQNIEEVFYSNLAGSCEEWAAFLETFNNTMQEVDPEIEMIGVPPIVGPYGHQQIYGRARWMVNTGITVQSKSKEDAMKFLNWFYSPEGIEVTNFGVEGVTFDKVDGQNILKEDYATFEKSRKVGMNKTMGPIVMTTDYYNQCLFAGKSLDEISENGRKFYDGLNDNIPYIYLMPVVFTTNAGVEYGADVWTPLADAEAQAITGAITIEQFQKTLDTIKKSGLDAITKEMNEIYQTVLGEN